MGPLDIGLGVLNYATQDIREQRAMKNQKKLMDLQMKNQMQLNTQGHNLQYQMWKNTNYPAQMEMLKQAGLNPGLLYGMSGGGGTTTGSQGGGSASGGSAPGPQQMDIGIMLQSAMTQAQIDLAKAQAEKARAEAGAIPTTIKETETNIGKLIAETKNIETQTRLKALEADIAEMEKAIKPDQLQALLDNVIASTKKTLLETDITAEQRPSIISEAQARAQLKWLEIEAVEAGIKLTEAQRQQIYTGLQQEWAKLGVQQEANKISLDRNNIEAFKAIVDEAYPNLWEVAGKNVNDALKMQSKLMEMLNMNSRYPKLKR